MTSSLLMPCFGIGITLFFFAISKRLQLGGFLLLNPLIIAISGIILFLNFTGVSFETYQVGGKFLTYFLGPAVVALGAFFYEIYEKLRRDFVVLASAVVTGGLCGVVSMVIFLSLLKMPLYLIQSLAAKSVTTPIAVEITKVLGGIPDITAGVVIAVGIFGNVFGPFILKISGITEPKAIGAAMGTAAHGIGTARALQLGKIEGVYGGVAMCINGIITAIVTPFIFNFLLI